MKILHIITGLNMGGAETMLYKLLSQTHGKGWTCEVISLTDAGMMLAPIAALGVQVRCLGLSRKNPNPLLLLRLGKWIREFAPAVTQTWMYHGDLLGGVTSKLCSNAKIIWGIRHSSLETDRWTTIQIARLCAVLSRWVPDKIVCCSEASRRAHEAMGYDRSKMTVIPNAFDTGLFKPDAHARAALRATWEADERAVVFGLAGRYHPQKDHRNFVEAAGRVARQCPHATFVLVGDGMTSDNAELMRWIRATEFEKNFVLLGQRADMPQVMAGWDAGILASASGEGFPNVLGEMMACEVPCVATDVGDSATIVGKTGFIVPPKDAEALAKGMMRMIEIEKEGRKKLGKLARERVIENFLLENVIKRYTALYC